MTIMLRKRKTGSTSMKLFNNLMKFGIIIKALTRLAMDKTPKDLEDVFDVSKIGEY